MTVDILGTQYTIRYKDWTSDSVFARNSFCGVCYENIHEIYICNMRTVPAWEYATGAMCLAHEKLTLRHEIVHAFLNESGLQESSSTYDEGWARNEEMVDWFAVQGPKIFKAWEEVHAL